MPVSAIELRLEQILENSIDGIRRYRIQHQGFRGRGEAKIYKFFDVPVQFQKL